MPLALLYDIHGNLPALEAVLEDVRAAAARGGAVTRPDAAAATAAAAAPAAAGHTRFLLGGDYAMFGPWPRETVERLKQLENAHWIRGNVDRWTANPHDAPDHPMPQSAIAACRSELGDDLVNELGALPEQLTLDGIRYCHASPLSDVRSFFPEPAPDEEELLDGVTEQRLVFGHTHLPFSRSSANGIELINPGSVGVPLDGDTRAAYALLHDGGEIEHRRVDYDAPASAAALRERFERAEFAEVVARRIERARLETG
jgi:diadenosine tetraphosphatase ApaH/serine/threonine PP2A family protein phosphatase